MMKLMKETTVTKEWVGLPYTDQDRYSKEKTIALVESMKELGHEVYYMQTPVALFESIPIAAKKYAALPELDFNFIYAVYYTNNDGMVRLAKISKD